MISKNWDLNSPLNTNILKMARVLPAWNVSTFGNIFKNKKRLLAQINGVRCLLATSQSQMHINLDLKLRKELDEVLKQEELFWFQKSQED